MLTPNLAWSRKVESRFLKLAPVEVEGLVGSYAVIDAAGDVVRDGLESGVGRLAQAMQDYARAMAKWKDRTTAARTNLWGAVQIDPPYRYVAALEGDQMAAPHLFWLETRWGGRYAIIGPTQEVFASRAGDIVAGEVSLDLRGQGSKFRSNRTGRFI